MVFNTTFNNISVILIRQYSIEIVKTIRLNISFCVSWRDMSVKNYFPMHMVCHKILQCISKTGDEMVVIVW
jgi:hypothetical protein